MKSRFSEGAAVRYKPGFGTYGYEDSLEADGRIPGVVVGFTPTRVRVALTVVVAGVPRSKTVAVEAGSLRDAARAEEK